MVEKREIKNLASAIQYWLSYWDTVSRTNILQEGSLRYSISEIIERRFQGTCILEKTHPVFPSRNIDIVWAEKGCASDIIEPFIKRGNELLSNNKLKNEIELLYENNCVIECKVLKQAYSSKDVQEIFDDICRLYFFKRTYLARQAFLIITGINKKPNLQQPSLEPNANETDGKQNLSENDTYYNEELRPKDDTPNHYNENSAQDIDEGIYQWLSYDTEKPIKLEYRKDKNYKAFYKDYNKRDKRKNDKSRPLSEKDKKISFITAPIAINYPIQDNETSHGVGIWEILLTKNEDTK